MNSLKLKVFFKLQQLQEMKDTVNIIKAAIIVLKSLAKKKNTVFSLKLSSGAFKNILDLQKNS